ncbi:MAG: hypothetical protein ACRDK8_13320, partial [Solirubrobacteraceae bacterium]
MVSDPLHPLLALGAEIEMILKRHAQQLLPIRHEPGLQVRMLKPTRPLVAERATPAAATIRPASGTASSLAKGDFNARGASPSRTIVHRRC